MTLLAVPVARSEDAKVDNDVVINFSTTGSVIVDFTFKHPADGDHFCTSAAGPWSLSDASSSSGYELRYDAGPRRAAEHFRMRAAGYQTGATAHSSQRWCGRVWLVDRSLSGYATRCGACTRMSAG